MAQSYYSIRSCMKLQLGTASRFDACFLVDYARFRGAVVGAGIRGGGRFQGCRIAELHSRGWRASFLTDRSVERNNYPARRYAPLSSGRTMWLQSFRQLYSLDTLDTRFVVPATAPPKEALELRQLDPATPLPVRDGHVKSREEERAQPVRWNTPEFYVYFPVIAYAIYFMFKKNIEVSKG
jgi:hypothetical protein